MATTTTKTERGHIMFRQRGLIQTYACSCGGDVEPSEMGAYCYTCGASAAWPGA